jgi:coproporphyrinogen III oxidase
MKTPQCPPKEQKNTARLWFETCGTGLCRFEKLENEASGPTAVRFQQTPWTRESDGGGGVMSMLHGGSLRKWACIARPSMASFRGISSGSRARETIRNSGLRAFPSSPISGINIPAVRGPCPVCRHLKPWFGGGADPDTGSGSQAPIRKTPIKKLPRRLQIRLQARGTDYENTNLVR